MERVEGRNRGPGALVGDVTPGGALDGRRDETGFCDNFSEAAVW